MVRIEGREVPDAVPITLVTVRQPGCFLPGFGKIARRIIEREERNIGHANLGKEAGVDFRREGTENGKSLVHSGVCVEVNGRMPGETLSSMIERLGMEGQATEIKGDNKPWPDKKIELRSTLHPDRRLRREGWLTKEDLRVLKVTFRGQQVRVGRIWINPAINPETGKTFYVANIMIGRYNPADPAHAGLPNFVLPLTTDHQLDVKALMASRVI